LTSTLPLPPAKVRLHYQHDGTRQIRCGRDVFLQQRSLHVLECLFLVSANRYRAFAASRQEKNKATNYVIQAAFGMIQGMMLKSSKSVNQLDKLSSVEDRS